MKPVNITTSPKNTKQLRRNKNEKLILKSQCKKVTSERLYDIPAAIPVNLERAFAPQKHKYWKQFVGLVLRQADLMLYFLEHGLTAAGGFSTSPAGLFPLTWDDERQQS
jgi:hypothetical protein